MKHASFFVLVAGLAGACGRRAETVRPVMRDITESVYASGTLQSRDQYNAAASVTGIVSAVLVAKGDRVYKGQPVIMINDAVQRLTAENARLTAAYDDVNANRDKVRDARLNLEVLWNRMTTDSSLAARQTALWKQQIGTRVDYEQRQLAYVVSKSAWRSAALQLAELERQLKFASAQAKKNAQISGEIASQYIVRSDVAGRVFDVPVNPGETVTPQTTVAVIGDDSRFVLELQVDEYDINRVRPGQDVVVTMDSYRGSVFHALVRRVIPIMNSRSKTFTAEAEFVQAPAKLFPNGTVEANIVTRVCKQAMLVPRDYVANDSTVLLADKRRVKVRVGVADYRYAEILSGLRRTDELLKPKP